MTVLEWNTTSDWDNAQSQSGVAHESVANTDHDDASILRKGYEYSNIFKSADSYIYSPMDEDSGSTINDLSGNNRDGSVVNGGTVNVTGDLGTSGVYLDNADDYVTYGDLNVPGQITMIWWGDLKGTSGEYFVDFGVNDGVGGITMGNLNGNYGYNVGHANTKVETDTSTSTGQQMLAITYNSSAEVAFYKDATVLDSRTLSGSLGDTGRALAVGAAAWDLPNRGLEQDCWFFGVWNSAFTATEIQTFYDVVATDGTLTTGTKTS